jgi:hypothetical protein
VDQDLIDLLSGWRGEPLDPARQQHLLERLRRDDAFQQSFIDEIHMLGMIRVVQSTEPRWLRLHDELGWGSVERAADHELEEELMRRVRGIPIHAPGRRRVLGVVAAAAVILIAGLAVVSWPKGRSDVPAPVAAAPEIRPGAGLALVVTLEAVRWEPGQAGSLHRGSILGPGRLRLRSGRASLSFFSGVTLTLEGPADVDLVAIDRVFCRRGRLRARVPEGAKGFVVASQGSAVVDLGTEFALNVEADGKARVMVFEGLAEAALLDATGSPTRTQMVEQSKAFELDPHTGLIAEAVARPEGFVTAPGSAAAHLTLHPDYAAAVLRARPRGYWRFETLEGGAVPNEVSGGPPLRVTGPISVGGLDVSSGVPKNGCAVFAAGEPAQFLSTDDLWVLAQDPGHAVELWFLSEGISHASLVGFFKPKDYLALGHHGRHIHSFLLELTAWDRQSLFKPASIRFLHRWPLDSRIGSNLLSDEIYIPGRWHHLVAQKNGPQIELYHDGVQVHSLLLQPDHPDVACRLVVGRRTPDPQELEDTRAFVGRLDELAVYDHPLAAEEVRHHFQLATGRAGPD